MTLAVNAMYSLVQLSSNLHRTQLMSRVWVSLLLAVAAASFPFLRTKTRCRLQPGALLAGVFVCMGILGGLERQDYFESIWKRQRRELRSLVAAAPAIDRSAFVILRLPTGERGAATYNTYLARSWMHLLYDDRSIRSRVFVTSDRGGGCRARGGALECWDERRRRCIQEGSCEGQRIPVDRALVLEFAPGGASYRISDDVESIVGDAAWSHAAAYDPLSLVGSAAELPLRSALLSERRPLGPAFETALGGEQR
jgi:hypothetical protein